MPQVGSTYSPYFAPGPIMPTIMGPDPTVGSPLGVVPQTVVTQQKMPRSDRLEVRRRLIFLLPLVISTPTCILCLIWFWFKPIGLICARSKVSCQNWNFSVARLGLNSYISRHDLAQLYRYITLIFIYLFFVILHFLLCWFYFIQLFIFCLLTYYASFHITFHLCFSFLYFLRFIWQLVFRLDLSFF